MVTELLQATADLRELRDAVRMAKQEFKAMEATYATMHPGREPTPIGDPPEDEGEADEPFDDDEEDEMDDQLEEDAATTAPRPIPKRHPDLTDN